MFQRRRSFPLLRRMLCYLSFARVYACGLRWSFFCVDYDVSFLGGNVVIAGGEVECFV